jgi:solute:Na+ symporter, SSS family
LLVLSITLYLLLTIAIGAWASRKVRSSGDYILAGRSLPMLLSASALFATWFGSETVFGASSEFLHGGLIAVIEDPFGAALCLILFGTFYARKLYKMNLLTLGDLFRVRFGKRAELLAAFLMVPSYFGYIAAQLVAMGLIMNAVADTGIVFGILISAGIVTFYTFIGGMWAISITDFIQSILIITGLAILAYIMAEKAGGAMVILNEVPADTFQFFPETNPKAFLAWIAAWSVLGLGSIPSQDVFQRAMSSGSSSIAWKSCYIAAALYLTVAMLPLFISLATRYLYPEQLLADDAQLVLPAMVLAHTTLPVQILFFGSLLSAIMSTTSAAMLAPAAILSENIIKPLRKKSLSDKQMLLLTRLAVLAMSAIATVLACWRTNIYELVAESSIFSLVSLFVPLTAALYWQRANAFGALISMCFGMISWLICLSVETEIHPLMYGLLAAFVGMFGGTFIGAFYKIRLEDLPD